MVKVRDFICFMLLAQSNFSERARADDWQKQRKSRLVMRGNSLCGMHIAYAKYSRSHRYIYILFSIEAYEKGVLVSYSSTSRVHKMKKRAV